MTFDVGRFCSVSRPLSCSRDKRVNSKRARYDMKLSFSAAAVLSLVAGTLEADAFTNGFLGGLSLAGFDFGSNSQGFVTGGYTAPPVEQARHFASQGVTVFRIPFLWQRMTPELGGPIDESFFSEVDQVVQACLNARTRPHVILDLHNFGRWNGGIVGQTGGPSAEQFASLWRQLARRYRGASRIMFGLMNEPHNQDLQAFSVPLQQAVNAIRGQGANSQYILLPGIDFQHADTFLTLSKPILAGIYDPAGGQSLLIYDIHQYLDADESGRSPECVTSRADLWSPIATDLRRSGRKAMVTEIGGGSTSSCFRYLNSALSMIRGNSDAFLGFTAWAGGAFSRDYELSLTPTKGRDTAIWKRAVRPNLR